MKSGVNPKSVLDVITIFGPMVLQYAKYIHGGSRPKSMSALPDTLQSEIELRRAEVRAREAKEAPST